MSNYRTIREVEEEYLRNHPDELDEYLTVLFDEYAENSDTSALLASLRVVGRVKGLSHLAEVSGLSRQGVQKALSENGNPQFGSVNAILHAMGYRLTPQKL
jgi:probable addiction module antidote protein